MAHLTHYCIILTLVDTAISHDISLNKEERELNCYIFHQPPFSSLNPIQDLAQMQ